MTRALLGIAMILFAGKSDRDPSADQLARYGDAAWKTGDFHAAAEWYERVVSLNPHSPEPLYNLALSYYRLELYDSSLLYLDRAQSVAHGSLPGRCFLLRADIEFRKALAEKPARQAEGLERALSLYRLALAAGAEPGITRYDIEVVKLRLPIARSHAPNLVSAPNAQSDVSADEAAAGSAGPESKGRGKSQAEDRDW